MPLLLFFILYFPPQSLITLCNREERRSSPRPEAHLFSCPGSDSKQFPA